VINLPQSDGTIGQLALTPGTVSEYNADVRALQASVQTPSPSAVAASPATTSGPQSPIGAGIDGELWGSGTVSDGSGASVSYLGSALVRRSIPGGSVLVPAGWAYLDQSIPSDHDDVLYFDPANPTARFEFSASGCTGCVTNSGQNPAGNPRAVLPANTISSFIFDGRAGAGFQEKPWLGYDVNGVVLVTKSRGEANGYATYRVALPPSDTPLATKILNSVQIS